MYVDGTDGRYHIPDDYHGIRVFFSKESAMENTECWQECGIVELTLDCSKPKMVVEEDWELAKKNAKNIEEISFDYIKEGPIKIWKEIKYWFWGIKEYLLAQYRKIKRL